MIRQTKKQLIDKLSNFDKITWKRESFSFYIHSVSRSEALTGRVSERELEEKTHGTCYSTKLNGYSIGLYFHNSPEKYYQVLVFKGSLPLEPLHSSPDLKLNKQEAKRLYNLVDKQVQTYLAEKQKKEEKAEERKEKQKINKKELKVLENLLK